MTEYAFNAFISIIIQMFSFLANYEFESRMSFDQIEFDENTAKDRINRFRDRKIIFTHYEKYLKIRKKTHEKESD